MSWKRPRSPVTIHVGPAARGRGADPRGDQAVDPVGAAVAEEEHLGRRRRQERLLVADRHARGRVDEVAVARRAAPSAACSARLGRLARAPSSSACDRRRRRAARRRARPPATRSRPSPRGARRARRPAARGSARTIVSARSGAARSSRSAGSTTTWRSAAERRQPLAQRLAGRHVAEAEHRSGASAGGRSAGDRVVGARRRASRSWRPEAQLRGRLGEDRVARAARRARRPARRARVELAAGDDQAPRRGRRPARRARRAAPRRRGGGAGGDGGQRPLAAALERERRGRGHVAGARLGAERVAPGDVEVDRARARLAARRREGPAGDRAEVEQAGVVGLVGADLAEPAHRGRRRASAGRSSARRRSRAAPAGGRR